MDLVHPRNEIKTMMNSVNIVNFKNLRDFSLDGWNRVNLIVGRNNVGKSSLLEALALYFSNGNEMMIRSVLSDRGIIEEDNDAFLSLFTDFRDSCSRKNDIYFSEKKDFSDALCLRQRYLVRSKKRTAKGEAEYQEFMSEEELSMARLSGQGADKVLQIESPDTMAYCRFSESIIRGTIKERCRVSYIPSFAISSSSNASAFDRISMTKLERKLIEALQIIDPDIEQINFLTNYGHSERVPYVVLKGSENKCRLSTMGDGINRVLTIILKMLDCEDGVFLLDEFEDGLHYSVQTDLWRIIFQLSEMLRIQVFVTSHSSDCIRSFVAANESGEGRLIRLEERKGQIIPVVYAAKEEIEFASSNGVELR